MSLLNSRRAPLREKVASPPIISLADGARRRTKHQHQHKAPVRLTLFYVGLFVLLRHGSTVLYSPDSQLQERVHHESLPLALMATNRISSNINEKTRNATDALVMATKGDSNNTTTSSTQSHRCQIIYVVGVEGSQHHGTTEMMESFAKHQVDPNGEPFVVHSRDMRFRNAIDWYRAGGTFHNVAYDARKEIMAKLCPSNDLRQHVIIEDTSFPSGIHGREGWRNMTALEIAFDLKENPRPLDLNAFARAFAPFADVKFIVLHRPYVNTVVSHHLFDGGTGAHAKVLSGHLRYLSALFGENHHSANAPWTLLCVDKLRQDQNDRASSIGKAMLPRERILAELSTFLNWPSLGCPSCFTSWKDSTKDLEKTVGREDFEMLQVEREKMIGIWPPALNFVHDNNKREALECPL